MRWYMMVHDGDGHSCFQTNIVGWWPHHQQYASNGRSPLESAPVFSIQRLGNKKCGARVLPGATILAAGDAMMVHPTWRDICPLDNCTAFSNHWFCGLLFIPSYVVIVCGIRGHQCSEISLLDLWLSSGNQEKYNWHGEEKYCRVIK